jgi:hypothetical protein
MLKYLFMVLCLMSLMACGSSGGDDSESTPTSPTQTFDVSKIYNTTLGTIYSTQLTGSDSNGTSYSGFFSVANRAQTMLGGVLVTPQDSLLNLTDGTSSSTSTATTNFDTSGNRISIENQTTGLACIPAYLDSAPTTVRIGDFDTRATLRCNDDTTIEGSWRAEDGKNGTIKYITNATVKNQFSTITQVINSTIIVNGSGDIVSTKIETTIPASNYTLTYQST